MDLMSALRDLRGVEEKTASVQEHSEKTASPREELLSALKSVTEESTAQTKEASASDPVADVTAMAQKIASTEKAASIKEAEILGAAFAKSAVNEFSNMTNASQKIASSNQNVDQVKQAAYEQGQRDMHEALEKRAQDDYNEGFRQGEEEIAKVAMFHFETGVVACDQFLAQLPRK